MIEKDLSTDIFTVDIFGPFRTNIFLDFQQLITEGYEPYQKLIKQDMEQRFKDCDWHFPLSKSGQVYKSGADGRGRTLVPRYFVGATTKECSLPLSTSLFSPKIDRIRVRIYEFGFGTFSINLRLNSEGTPFTAINLRKVADEISDMIEKNELKYLSDLIQKVIKGFKDLAPRRNIDQLQPLDKEFSERENWAEAGNVMWTHRLFTYKLQEESNIRKAIDQMTGLLNPPAEINTMEIKDHTRAVGFGVANSVIIVTNDEGGNSLHESASRTLQAANVYSAVAYYIHNSLFWFSNYHAAEVRKSKNNIRKALELEYDVIMHIQCSAQVTSLITQYKLYLDPQSKKIWDIIDEAWDIKKQLENVGTQIELCEKLYDRMTNKIRTDQQSRLNNVAMIFTCISALALIEISQRQVGIGWPLPSVAVTLIIVSGIFILFATTMHGIQNITRKYWEKAIQKIKGIFSRRSHRF